MDATETNIMSMIALILSIGGGIITAINHKRIRSSCCKRELTVSVDLENTTPPVMKEPKTPKATKENPPA